MKTEAYAVAEKDGCPFATPGVSETPSVAFYCRLPGGRVRVPTADERVRYCLPGNHALCPTLRRYIRDN